jgi:hypothetical protein
VVNPASSGTRPELQAEVATVSTNYPNAPFLLFAMGLWLRSMDLAALEANGLLDGTDDKKIDFFQIDEGDGVATIAQGYAATDWSKPLAPSSKAAELNTAVAWLLESDLDDIPRPAVRAAAEQLRDALSAGRVRRVEILFVHNLSPTPDVDGELATAERSLNQLLTRYAANGVTPTGTAHQLDADRVDRMRRSLHDAILVTDTLTLNSQTTPGQLEGPEWKAVSGTATGRQLSDWLAKYGDDLFNANVRDFLGTRESRRNINNQIRETALGEPQNFWIFNNGITILTNGVAVAGLELELLGASIINGAQTTGSLLQARNDGPIDDVLVPIRAIECRNPELISKIIRFNNLQNPVTAWDRRSIDPLQLRLQGDLSSLGITYQIRRGMERRRATDVHLDKLGPYLVAFYGEPLAAANKSEVFDNETRYRQAFRDGANPLHILFVYLLGESVDAAKVALRRAVDSGGALGDDAEQTYRYFRYGAFSYIVIAAAARVLGVWLAGRDRSYLEKVALRPDPVTNLAEWTAICRKLVDAVLLAIRSHLRAVGEADLYDKMKTTAGATEIANAAAALVEQVQGMTADTYREITDELTLP